MATKQWVEIGMIIFDAGHILWSNINHVYVKLQHYSILFIIGKIAPNCEPTPPIDWSMKWDLTINFTKCNYLTIGQEVPLRLSFFPDGSGTPIPVSKLVKDLEVQADNMFSHSTQCTEAANKTRPLIFMIAPSKISRNRLSSLYTGP